MSSIVKNTVLIGLFSAVICVCSLVSIPLFGVPITLQGFGIYTALLILGGARGSAAVAVYIFIGAIGMPVFSGFSGGFGRLFDASGGYIFGFMIASLVFWVLTSIFGDKKCYLIIFTVVSQLVIYICGALWFALAYSSEAEFWGVITVCILPFVIPDAMKIALAFFASERIKKHVKL